MNLSTERHQALALRVGNAACPVGQPSGCLSPSAEMCRALATAENPGLAHGRSALSPGTPKPAENHLQNNKTTPKQPPRKR